jgi:antitoxin (DNA-binding transcriptional repressor) of toxin-antitoxin stability system
MKATILDLRYRTKDVLKAVERGETVAVLYRGKEKALIVPSPAGQVKTNLRDQRAFGMWKDRKDLANVGRFVRELRKGRRLGL